MIQKNLKFLSDIKGEKPPAKNRETSVQVVENTKLRKKAKSPDGSRSQKGFNFNSHQRITSHCSDIEKSYPSKVRKQILLKKIGECQKKFSATRAGLYLNFIKASLEEVEYNPNKITREIIEKIYEQNDWDKKHIWPKTALNKFLKYLKNDKAFPFQVNNPIREYGKYNFKDLPQNIKNTVIELLTGRKSEFTSEEIKSNKIYIRHVAIYNGIINEDFGINPTTIRDLFKPEYQKHYFNVLKEYENAELSPKTGGKAITGAYEAQTHMKKFLQLAVNDGKITKNTVKDKIFNKPTLKGGKAGKYIRETNRRKLITVSEAVYKKLPSKEDKYTYVLITDYLAALLAYAARVTEPSRFFKEDIKIHEVRSSGLIEAHFRKKKHRPSDKVIPIWGRFHYLEAPTKLYLKEVHKRRKQGIKPKQLEIKNENGKLISNGTPFFQKYDGSPLNYSDLTKLFKWKLNLEKIDTNIHLRDFRATAATLLYRDGFAMEEIRDSLGHKHVKITRNYLAGINEVVCYRLERKIKKDIANISEGYDLRKDENRMYFEKIVIDAIRRKLKNNSDTLDKDFSGLTLLDFDREIMSSLKTEGNLESEDTYTTKDIQEKLGLAKTQTNKKITQLRENNIINCKKQNGRYLIPKYEIDNFIEQYARVSELAKLIGLTWKNIKYPKQKIRDIIKKHNIKTKRINKIIYIDKLSFFNWYLEEYK